MEDGEGVTRGKVGGAKGFSPQEEATGSLEVVGRLDGAEATLLLKLDEFLAQTGEGLDGTAGVEAMAEGIAVGARDAAVD